MTARACPATEPEETGLKEPWPRRRPRRRRPARESALLSIDTGWLQVVANYPTKWLARGVSGEPEPERPALREYAGHGTFIAGVLRCRAPKADIDHLRYGDGGAVSESVLVGRLSRGAEGKETPTHHQPLGGLSHVARPRPEELPSAAAGARHPTRPTPCWSPPPATTGLTDPFFPAAVRLGGRRRLAGPGRAASRAFSNYRRVGRRLRPGTQPRQRVPQRAATSARRRPNKGDVRGSSDAGWRGGAAPPSPLRSSRACSRPLRACRGQDGRDRSRCELVQNGSVEQDPVRTATTAFIAPQLSPDSRFVCGRRAEKTAANRRRIGVRIAPCGTRRHPRGPVRAAGRPRAARRRVVPRR